ncbi:MAG: NAD-dependent DNA ligase LigA [Youngiibacter sp.]|nr:NAD-dependent DNA ligase LigA [Youngiibacter sp.]
MDRIKRMEELVSELNRLSREYYVLDSPSVNDAEYDKKYDLLKAIEAETGIVLPDSPTQRVGDSVLPEFRKHTHKGRLWSLDKAQSLDELHAWHMRNIKFVEATNAEGGESLPLPSYVITRKFDGLTLNLTYEDGLLVTAATRGTGAIGEEVTAQAKTIKSVPLRIPDMNILEIHGEAMMTKTAFRKYNEESDAPLKNTRNGAAGALRNLNLNETRKRNLTAYFYDIGYIEGKTFSTYTEMLGHIRECGFLMDEYIRNASTFSEIEAAIREIESGRADLDFDIDGAVIAIDDARTRELLGYTVKFPKWAIAYKFEAEEAVTRLLDVEWNVGRSGRVAPTAILDPVDLAGVTVRRATLNNMDDVRRKNVRIGGDVLVRRSNDVIPEILRSVSEGDEGTREIVPPDFCPSCGTPLVLTGAHYFCDNTLSCKPQMVKSIVHYTSRDAMNIEGLSEKTAEQLFESLGVKSISDIYRLKKEDLLKLEKFGDKKADNILKAIEDSKGRELHAFLYALGIPNVGVKTARDLSERFGSLEKIRDAELQELLEVPEVGGIVAESIHEFFRSQAVLDELERIRESGVTPKSTDIVRIESPFTGKTVVVTGTLKSFGRKEIEEKLISLGAKVSSSVSKKTDFVLYGEEAGSKLTKARDLNVRTITEDEFLDMAGGQDG